jgi:hypothetical protein
MNERIKSLLAQAHLDVMENLGDIDTNVVAERFAELLIQKCVGIADDYVKDCTCEEHVNCKHPRSAIGRKIREHFGVEE